MIGILGIIIAILAGALFGISAFAGAEIFKLFTKPKKVTTSTALEDKLAKKRRRLPTISKWGSIPSDTSCFDGSMIDAPPSATLNGTCLVTPHAGHNGSAPDVDADSAVVVRLLLVGSTLSVYEINEEEEYARREHKVAEDKKWLARKAAAMEASAAKRAAAEAFAATAEGQAKRVPALLASDSILGKITLSPLVMITMDEDDGKHQIRLERHTIDDGVSATTTKLNSRHRIRPDKPGLFDCVPRQPEDASFPDHLRNKITNEGIPQWNDAVLTFETYREACRWYEALFAATAYPNTTKGAPKEESIWTQALRSVAAATSSAVATPVVGAIATRLLADSLNHQGISSPLTKAFTRSLNFSSLKLQDAPVGAMAAHGVFEGFGIAMSESILPISTSALITAPATAAASSPFSNFNESASAYSGSTAQSTVTASLSGAVIGRVGAALKLVSLRAGQSNAKGHTTLASRLRLGTLCNPSEKPYDDVSEDEDDGNHPPLLLYPSGTEDLSELQSKAAPSRNGEVNFDLAISTANSRTPFVEAIFQIFVHSEPANADHDLDEAASMAPSNNGTNSGLLKDEIRVLPPLYVYTKVECVDGHLRANIAPPSASQASAAATKTPELWFGFYGRPAATVTADIIDPTTYRSFYSDHLQWDVEAIRLGVKTMAAIKPYEAQIATAVADGVYAALFDELTLPHYGSLPMPVVGDGAQSSDVSAAWERAADALTEAYTTARLELHEAQCAGTFADVANMNGFASPLRTASLSGGVHPFSVGAQSQSVFGRSAMPPSSPFHDRASFNGRGSIRGGQSSVVVPWLQTQALNEPAKTVTAADVASLSKWSFLPNRTPYEQSLNGGNASQSASQAGGPLRPSTPLRRLYHRAPSPSPLLANEDPINSTRDSEHRFETAESPANHTVGSNYLSASQLPSGRPTHNPHYEESLGGGSVAAEISSFRRREEQMRATLAEAHAQAAREKAIRIANEEANDRRRQEESKRNQERLAELERRMLAERERDAKKKLQEELDNQNDEERTRRRVAEGQLQDEKRQRAAEEDATTSRLVKTEKAIQVLSDAIQNMADLPRRRGRRTFSGSSSDSDKSRGTRRSRTSRAATPLTQSLMGGSPLSDERVNQIEEQIRARDNEHRQRQLEEDNARRSMGDTINDLSHKLKNEIDNNKQREEEERRHREREEALSKQILTMQQKQLELQQAIDSANALGDQVRDREQQLRNTEEALELLKDHLMSERNEQTALQQERLAEEHQREEKERAEAAARARQQQEATDRLAGTQRELESLKEKALAAERERAEQKAAEEKERKKSKEDRAERRKAQERLKEAEDAIIALQAQLVTNGSLAPKSSNLSSSAPTPRALSASRRAGSRIPANGRNSPLVVNRAPAIESSSSPLPPLVPQPPVAERKREEDEGDSDFEYQTRRYNSQPRAASPNSAASPPTPPDASEEEISDEAMQNYLAPSFGATIDGALEITSLQGREKKAGEGFIVGDVLLEANGSPLTGLRHLYELAKTKENGDLVIVNVLRDKGVEPVTVELRSLQ